MNEAAAEENNLHRLVTATVMLLCWIQRYQSQLFQGYRTGDIPCLILMGGCADSREALFVRYLSFMPVDVLLLAPDLNRPCCFKCSELLELKG